MSGTPGMAIWSLYFGSQNAFQLVGAGTAFCGEYSITRLSKVTAGACTPGVKARGERSAMAGTLLASTSSNSPSSLAALATETSIITHSTCGLAFCARNWPSAWAELPIEK